MSNIVLFLGIPEYVINTLALLGLFALLAVGLLLFIALISSDSDQR